MIRWIVGTAMFIALAVGLVQCVMSANHVETPLTVKALRVVA